MPGTRGHDGTAAWRALGDDHPGGLLHVRRAWCASVVSAMVLDDLAGLIGSVTVSVLGHVLAEGRERAPSRDAGVLGG